MSTKPAAAQGVITIEAADVETVLPPYDTARQALSSLVVQPGMRLSQTGKHLDGPVGGS
jgi:hypothetical protein